MMIGHLPLPSRLLAVAEGVHTKRGWAFPTHNPPSGVIHLCSAVPKLATISSTPYPRSRKSKSGASLSLSPFFPCSSVHLHVPTNNQLGAEPSSSFIIPTLNMHVHPLTHQVLTSTIFLGWTCLVVSLSQAGKRTAMTALTDAAKGIAQGSLETMEGQHGMGVFASMAGGE
jgi:hypothetical protein